MRKILNRLSFFLFILSAVMTYAFVYDVEPVDPVKEYLLEKEAFDRSNSDWFREFPDFQDWVNDQVRREERLKEWTESVKQEIGDSAAAAFDPWYDPNSGYYKDLTEGHPAAAPENWATGERG